jgi:hypothetical protein
MIKKSTRILALILSFLIAVFCIQAFVGFVHQACTRTVEVGFGAALHQLQGSPPGPERARIFVARLKAINTDHAPAEVRQALQDYIVAVERSLDAFTAGRNIAPYDSAIAVASQRLVDSVREYD